MRHSKLRSITYKFQRVAYWLSFFCPAESLRHTLLRAAGIKIGRDAHVPMGVVFVYNTLNGNGVSLGERVAVSPGVIFAAEISPNNSRLSELFPLQHNQAIVVDDDAWIGANATILAGVRIGKAAVIGAGALVSEDVPAASVSAGIPAGIYAPGFRRGKNPALNRLFEDLTRHPAIHDCHYKSAPRASLPSAGRAAGWILRRGYSASECQSRLVKSPVHAGLGRARICTRPDTASPGITIVVQGVG